MKGRLIMQQMKVVVVATRDRFPTTMQVCAWVMFGPEVSFFGSVVSPLKSLLG